MKYLVTGGAGFIGSHIVDKLIEKGNNVLVLDDFSTGKEENLMQHKENPNLQIIRGSVCENISEKIKNQKLDGIFHIAGLASVQSSLENKTRSFNLNAQSTINLLQLCVEKDIKRFIFASSAAVYGNQEKIPVSENLNPLPLSPYAEHKKLSEDFCKAFQKNRGIETIALRMFNVYGPRQDPKGQYSALIPKLIESISEDKKFTIYGDGKQTRDFVYVGDVAEAYIKSGETTNKNCFGKVFNIASGESASVNEIFEKVAKIANKEVYPSYGEKREGEIKDSLADIMRAYQILDWSPRTSLEEGLKKTYEFFSK